MCGIAGLVATDGHGIEREAVQRMSNALAHRGPDGQGFMLASHHAGQMRHTFMPRVDAGGDLEAVIVGLGHRRLAILDLSDRGLQPMATEDHRTWLVFNGEIYNYRELRAQLESSGHRFQTTTDTEVLLHSYVEWGDDCLQHIDGMFAFAVWDSERSRLFCARDRLGIKPFYYARPSGGFAFASEIKALVSVRGCEPRADDEAVTAFLVHGNCDFGERTVFKGIHALPAAHSLSLTLDGTLLIRQFWTPRLHATSRPTDDTHIQRLRESLTATMRRHLISDVKIGSCLSGGLDSSAVVGLIGQIQGEDPAAASAVGERLNTFTSCYNLKAFDEREYALGVAGRIGAESHLVFPSAHDFWSDFERIAWHQDMPFGSLSFYAQWRVMRAAKEAGVKVLLDGQGGDEVFGGYAKFRYAYLAGLLRAGRLPTATREFTGMLRQGDRYVLDVRNGFRYLPASVRRVLQLDSLLKEVLIPDWRQATSTESTPATRLWRYARTSRADSRPSLLTRIQMDDISMDTLPQLLRMEDRSSMAFSLEARVPLLDHHVVQFGLSLPDHLKINNGWSKFAMRQAIRGLVPESVRLRKTKLGFAAPDRRWLSVDLRSEIAALLARPLRCGRYIDLAALRRWHTSARAQAANTESYLGLFRILSLEMWMRAFGIP
jgi:asparagine synthase (glutamine-hydrolysing)